MGAAVFSELVLSPSAATHPPEQLSPSEIPFVFVSQLVLQFFDERHQAGLSHQPSTVGPATYTKYDVQKFGTVILAVKVLRGFVVNHSTSPCMDLVIIRGGIDQPTQPAVHTNSTTPNEQKWSCRSTVVYKIRYFMNV